MPARKYSWEEWLGAERVTLLHGVHYHCSQSTMAQSVRNAASARGIRVHIRDTGTAIIVEVVEREEAAGAV